MKSTVRSFAVLAMVALAACGGDDLGPNALDEAEATELASAIFSQGLFDAMALDYQPPAQAPGGPQLATYTATVETTGSCPMGGAVALTGSIDVDTDDQTGAGTVDFGLTLSHAMCVVQGHEGTTFTLTGNPSLVFNLLAESTGEGFGSFQGSVSGAVDYMTDEKEGTCQIGYEFSGEVSQSSFAISANGSVCGQDISQSVTVQG